MDALSMTYWKYLIHHKLFSLYICQIDCASLLRISVQHFVYHFGPTYIAFKYIVFEGNIALMLEGSKLAFMNTHSQYVKSVVNMILILLNWVISTKYSRFPRIQEPGFEPTTHTA